MTSKIVNFIRSQSRKHRIFSEVWKDMLADTMKLYILRRSGYREEKFQSGCFNCGKSCGISLPSKDTQCVLILKATFFWLFLDLNFLLWIVQPFTYERIWRGLYACDNNNAGNDRTRHVTHNSMKIGLPAHEVSLFNTRRAKKKESIAAAESCPPVVKNEVLYSVSRAFFTRRSTSLMSFFFSFNFDKNTKFLQK